MILQDLVRDRPGTALVGVHVGGGIRHGPGAASAPAGIPVPLHVVVFPRDVGAVSVDLDVIFGPAIHPSAGIGAGGAVGCIGCQLLSLRVGQVFGQGSGDAGGGAGPGGDEPGGGRGVPRRVGRPGIVHRCYGLGLPPDMDHLPAADGASGVKVRVGTTVIDVREKQSTVWRNEFCRV